MWFIVAFISIAIVLVIFLLFSSSGGVWQEGILQREGILTKLYIIGLLIRGVAVMIDIEYLPDYEIRVSLPPIIVQNNHLLLYQIKYVFFFKEVGIP